MIGNRYRGLPMKSKLESTFALALKSVGCEMEQQVKFHPVRRWRLDFATEDGTKVAVEIDGGEFIKGGGAHNRGARMAQDYEKRNSAIEMGFIVFQLTGGMCKKDPLGWANRVKAVIQSRLDSNGLSGV